MLLFLFTFAAVYDILDTFTGIFDALPHALTGLFHTFADAFASTLDAFTSAFAKFLDAFASALTDLFDTFSDALADFFNCTTNAACQVTDDLRIVVNSLDQPHDDGLDGIKPDFHQCIDLYVIDHQPNVIQTGISADAQFK